MVRAGTRPGPNPWLVLGEIRVTIEIVARPGAPRRGIVRVDSRGLIVALNSAPEQGKANNELIEYLARELKVARSAIAIVRGGTSRHKSVRVEPCEPAAITARLQALLRLTS
jgi:uncharacterized protein